eukprot:933434-Pelagomonas_calceolata.AAC.21
MCCFCRCATYLTPPLYHSAPIYHSKPFTVHHLLPCATSRRVPSAPKLLRHRHSYHSTPLTTVQLFSLGSSAPFAPAHLQFPA